MPNTTLRTKVKDSKGKWKEVTTVVNVTHNNARLLHTGGETYEYVGDDASGNRIYRDAKKVRGA